MLFINSLVNTGHVHKWFCLSRVSSSQYSLSTCYMSDKYNLLSQIFTYQRKFSHEEQNKNDNEELGGSVSLFVSVVDVVVTNIFSLRPSSQFSCVFFRLRYKI